MISRRDVFLSEDEMFSLEVINKRSRDTALTPYLAVCAFLKKMKIPIEDFAKFTGEKAAITWDGVKDAPPRTIAMYIAWNYAALGADNFKYDGDDKEAFVEIEEWPKSEHLAFWEITLEDVDAMNLVNAQILDYLGLTHEYKRAGNKITIKIKK